MRVGSEGETQAEEEGSEENKKVVVIPTSSVNANISQQEYSVYEFTQDKLDKQVKGDLGFSDGL